MDIVILGIEKKFVNSLSQEIKKKIHCMSIRSYLNWKELSERSEDTLISLLLVEVNIYNFKKCLQKVEEIMRKDARVIAIFLCDHILVDWQKKASDKSIYLLDKKKDYSEIVTRILKVITWKDSDVCELEFEELLTSKEEDVIRLIAKGRKQEAVAEDLAISRKTVQNHLSSISKKLNTTSQLESVIRAIELGIVEINYEISEEF